MNTPEWDRRIARAEDLAQEYAFSAEVLNFYARIAAFQGGLYDQAASHFRQPAGDHMRLRDQLDLNLALRHLPALFSLAEQHGPPGLSQAARDLRRQTEAQRLALLSTCAVGEEGGGVTARFFARTCLQPCAEYIARNSGVPLTGYSGPTCPLCDGRPLLAVLRPEGDGAKRSLICSFCLLEWTFRRIVCPACGEKENEKLPRYSAADFPHVRIEACDTCKIYLKSVDLTVNGLAVPLVDEIAAAPLDLWANEHGYSKIELNILGC